MDRGRDEHTALVDEHVVGAERTIASLSVVMHGRLLSGCMRGRRVKVVVIEKMEGSVDVGGEVEEQVALRY